MKDHVLCNFSEIVPKQANPYTVYDFSSQISYSDFKCVHRVIDCLSAVKNNSTIETANVENSDIDNYWGKMPSTVLTENVEHSDVDNLYLFGSTTETRSIETSDVDNLWKSFATITTFSTEDSDQDN